MTNPLFDIDTFYQHVVCESFLLELNIVYHFSIFFCSCCVSPSSSADLYAVPNLRRVSVTLGTLSITV